MHSYVYVPFDPADARIVQHRAEEAAIRWFKRVARTYSSARAHLTTADGRCIAAYGDGEFCDYRAR
jgi:hypothetical protein